jgi:hypothetical protein
MKLSTFAAGLFSLSLIVAGCSSSDSNGGGGTGGSGAGGSGTGGSSAGGSGAGGSGTGGSSATGGSSGDAGGGTTTYADVKPIFMMKCTPCHSAGGQGATAHTLADDDSTATKSSYFCSGKKKGECALVRVKNGSMPAGASCTGNPTTDASNNKCLTQAQQDKLQAWIDGGLKSQ